MTKLGDVFASHWIDTNPEQAEALKAIRAFDKKLGSKTAFFKYDLDDNTIKILKLAGLIFHMAVNNNIRLTERGRLWADKVV